MDGIASIGLDAKIKSDSEGNVVADIEINNYPLVSGVTTANTNGLLNLSRKRTINIYYRDNELYLRTTDEAKTLKSQYNRVTKIHPQVLLDNIGYYLQWLLGFTDMIQSSINQAINDSQSFTGETDMSNILIEYSLQADGRHKLVLNLGEIAHSSDLDNITLYIATTLVDVEEIEEQEDGTKVTKTVQKDYVYSLDLEMEMLGGTIALNTDSNNKLYLVDIGDAVDVSSANNFMDQYPYNQDGEYVKEGSIDSSNIFSGFSQTNANTVYLTFDTDGGQAISQMQGVIGQDLTLPTPTKVVNGITYQFIGWYYEDGNRCELTSFPRSNLTLYAKWFKYKLKFETNGGFDIDTIEAYEGTTIDLPQNPIKYVDKGDLRTYYEFEGWYLDENFEGVAVTQVVLNSNTTVYAKWRQTRQAETKTLYVYSMGRLLVKERYEIGATINLPEGVVGSYKVVDRKRVDYTKYYCSGWDKEVSVMGEKEIIVNAIWEQVDYRKYFKVTYVTDWYDPENKGVTYDDLDEKPATIKEEYVLQGGSVDLSKYSITAKYEYWAFITVTRNYKVVGWSTTPTSRGSTAQYTTSYDNIQGNITLYAVWAKA